jgi:type IV pilus assembly protein PilM
VAAAGTGIAIGSHSVRAVSVRKKGQQYVVLRAIARRLDEEVRGEAGRWLASRGVTGPAVVGLTGKDVIIRYSQVPPVPEWRLRNLMKFEVDEVSNQSGGAVSADYRKLDLPDPEGTRSDETVLVALARNQYLEPLLSSLEGAGIKVAGGCPASVALFNAFATNATYPEDETCLLVNIGAQGMDIAVERGGELIFARSASPGGKAFTDAIVSAFSTTEAKAEALKLSKADVTPRGQARYPDPTAEKVANAILGVAGQVAALIQSTLMICRAQTKIPDLKVDRVRLAGGGASLKGLDAYLKQAMGVPVDRWNPFEGCDLSALPEDEKTAVEAAPHEYAVALGLAQSESSPAAFRLSVVPEATRKKREFATKGVFSVAAAVVAVGALAILYSARTKASADVAAQTKTLRDSEARATKLDTELRAALEARQEAQEKHRRLAEAAAPGVLFSESLSLLVSKLQPQIHLERVEMKVVELPHAYTLLHPVGGKKSQGLYAEREHTRRVRRASVVAIAHVAAGPNPAQVYQRFVTELRANDRGLVVATKGTLAAQPGGGSRFELEIARGVTFALANAAGAEPQFLQDARLADEDSDGTPETIVGRSRDGILRRVPLEEVEAEDKKRLLETVTAADASAKPGGEKEG